MGLVSYLRRMKRQIYSIAKPRLPRPFSGGLQRPRLDVGKNEKKSILFIRRVKLTKQGRKGRRGKPPERQSTKLNQSGKPRGAGWTTSEGGRVKYKSSRMLPNSQKGCSGWGGGGGGGKGRRLGTERFS